MKNKQEYGYVYYSAKGFEKHSEYAHPEIRLFEINRYPEEPGKIYLGKELVSFKAQIDRKHLMPYAFRAETNPFDFYGTGTSIAVKLISKIQKTRYAKNNPTKVILKALHKIKAKRLINAYWINEKSTAEWIPYSERASVQ